LNNHENNDSKPFYAATFLKLEEDNAVCTLADEERRDCGVAELKHPNF